MKPIHTLTWAVSAPILLFAGATHAVNVSDLTDAACSKFKYDSNTDKIVCDATPTAPPSCTAKANNSTTSISVSTGSPVTIGADCTQSPTSYTWTGTPTIGNVVSTVMPFNQAGTYTYKVKASNAAGVGSDSNTVTITVKDSDSQDPPPGNACRSNYVMPGNTTIVRMTGVDFYAGRNFNDVFDNGNKFDSKSDAGMIKALEFTNDTSKWGNIDGTGGNYGQTYKDWSISACPGDFSTTLSELPAKCRKIKALGVTLTYHATDATQGCVVPVGQTMYLNIRANDLKSPAGYVLSNSVINKLP